MRRREPGAEPPLLPAVRGVFLAGGASARRGGRGGPCDGVAGPVKLTPGVAWAYVPFPWLTKTTAGCGVDAYAVDAAPLRDVG